MDSAHVQDPALTDVTPVQSEAALPRKPLRWETGKRSEYWIELHTEMSSTVRWTKQKLDMSGTRKRGGYNNADTIYKVFLCWSLSFFLLSDFQF